MRSVTIITVAAFVGTAICFIPNAYFQGNQTLNIGSPINEAAIDSIASSTGDKATLYITLSPECPISRAYLPKLNRMRAEPLTSQIEFIGIIPASAAEGLDAEKFCDDYQVKFPIVLDHTNRMCQQLGATHVPEVVLIDAGGNRIYSGRIDDRFTRIAGAQRTVRDDSLANAIAGFLAGEVAFSVRTEPVGCLIEARPGASETLSSSSTDEITYCGDVAKIIFDNCSRCHRPNEIAPFSLLSYDETVKHALQIREVVERGLMPPWKPVSEFGHFLNEQRLTDEQVATIAQWVEAGTPLGSPADLPAAPVFTEGWQLGKPDLELVMPEPFDVPADGPDIYQHFIIPTGLTENRLVSGFEFRPGCPEVTHHAFAYFDTTGTGRQLDALDPQPGYSRIGSPGFAVSGSLGGWGPGGSPRELPIGMGRPLPKNADLVVQIHYHPSGRKVQDQSRIGIYFAEPWAERLVTQIMVSNIDLEIPANEARHIHKAEWTLPVDTIVLDITPHMHTLGKAIQAVAHLPDGTTTPLIRIDDWDFYWQDGYTFKHPIELPAGTIIKMACLFDNSANNPLNPNSPPKTVYWGDFSDDEMGICYLQATTKTLADFHKLSEIAQAEFQRQWDRFQTQKEARQVQNDVLKSE